MRSRPVIVWFRDDLRLSAETASGASARRRHALVAGAIAAGAAGEPWRATDGVDSQIFPGDLLTAPRQHPQQGRPRPAVATRLGVRTAGELATRRGHGQGAA